MEDSILASLAIVSLGLVALGLLFAAFRRSTATRHRVLALFAGVALAVSAVLPLVPLTASTGATCDTLVSVTLLSDDTHEGLVETSNVTDHESFASCIHRASTVVAIVLSLQLAAITLAVISLRDSSRARLARVGGRREESSGR